MLIVADSSALIALATCDGLDVVLHVYDDIKVPEAVYAEIVAPEKPQSDSLGLFLSGRVVKVDINKVTPYIQKLRQSSIHYGDSLLNRVLELAGE